MRVLVLGGHGFIGRHAVKALLGAGHKVIIGTRRPGAHATPCRERRVHFARLTAPESWVPVLTEIDVVLNCVGILRARWSESYRAVHCEAPRALAEACTRLHIARLVHISALGLSADARSGFLRSKFDGEEALRECAAHADSPAITIVRPSLLDGRDGFGARWLRELAQLPLIPLPGDARGRIAALHVDDLAEILARLIGEAAPALWREIELGGPARSLADHVRSLRAVWRVRPFIVSIPAWMAWLGAVLCDAVHVTPFSVGHLELLRVDNVPHGDAAATLLGRPLRVVGFVARNRPVPGYAAAAPRSGSARAFGEAVVRDAPLATRRVAE